MANEKPTIIEETPEAQEVSPSLVEQETPKEAVEPKAPRELQYVRVNPGDTVASLAAKYGSTVEKIAEDNKINPDFILVGHWLYI